MAPSEEDGDSPRPRLGSEVRGVRSAPQELRSAAEEDPAERKRKKVEAAQAARKKPAAPAPSAAPSSSSAAAPAVLPGGFDPCLIYVGGLPFWYTEEKLREDFGALGEIVKTHPMRFPDTGKFRGIALVTFAEPSAATAALEWGAIPYATGVLDNWWKYYVRDNGMVTYRAEEVRAHANRPR